MHPSTLALRLPITLAPKHPCTSAQKGERGKQFAVGGQQVADWLRGGAVSRGEEQLGRGARAREVLRNQLWGDGVRTVGMRSSVAGSISIRTVWAGLEKGEQVTEAEAERGC